MSDKTHHIFSQNPKYGYLNSSMLFDMVTATINANVRQEIDLNKPKSKNFKGQQRQNYGS